MSYKISRRLFTMQMLFFLAACATEEISATRERLVLGVVSYGEEKKILENFTRFSGYLGDRIKANIEVEPAFNENFAIERIKHRVWSIVFAPPGLAVVASNNYQYSPVFPLQIDGNPRSIFIVRKDSPLKNVKELQGKTVALGLPGSAAGYYLPLYNMLGLQLASIMFASTPNKIFESVASKKAAAGAMSQEDFNSHRPQYATGEFRILFTVPQNIPPGAVLLGPSVERNQQELIVKFMREAPPHLVQEAKYIPYGNPPDYKEMTSIVKRILPLYSKIRSQPTNLY